MWQQMAGIIPPVTYPVVRVASQSQIAGLSLACAASGALPTSSATSPATCSTGRLDSTCAVGAKHADLRCICTGSTPGRGYNLGTLTKSETVENHSLIIKMCATTLIGTHKV
jgi:hypothetical protein